MLRKRIFSEYTYIVRSHDVSILPRELYNMRSPSGSGMKKSADQVLVRGLGGGKFFSELVAESTKHCLRRAVYGKMRLAVSPAGIPEDVAVKVALAPIAGHQMQMESRMHAWHPLEAVGGKKGSQCLHRSFAHADEFFSFFGRKIPKRFDGTVRPEVDVAQARLIGVEKYIPMRALAEQELRVFRRYHACFSVRKGGVRGAGRSIPVLPARASGSSLVVGELFWRN